MSGTVSLEIDGKIATITNHNPEKHNAFDDEMDAQLFEILAELRARPDIRAVIWQGEGSLSPPGVTWARSATTSRPSPTTS